ncbi:hypothetical protein [Marinagarivorans algicola]|uniref:hypothetical protein n=1 Tax=Marinagarivorans algicola TaxID=1513270 RepID=UPI0006B514C9|nr:hypothetical protein [Marinagarivorans algicola]
MTELELMLSVITEVLATAASVLVVELPPLPQAVIKHDVTIRGIAGISNSFIIWLSSHSKAVKLILVALIS